jgi:glycosyltransferase involved in cell wall biosynthesis
VIVISRGWWPLVKGGAERFITRTTEELHDIGYRIAAVTLQVDTETRDVKAKYPIYMVKLPLRLPIVSSYLFSRRAASIARRLHPRVVIVNGYWGELAPIYVKKRNTNIPVITIIHDVGLVRSTIAQRQKIRHRLRMRALRHIVQSVDAIVVPLKSVADDLVEFFGADPAKIHVLGFEGVDAPFRRIHIENEYFDVVQVARFSPNKGQLTLLKATDKVAEKIPNLRVWLVGGVSASYRKYYEKVSDEAKRINEKHGKKIIFTKANASNIDDYYRLADVCVAASMAEEGYGLTIAECLGYGKPVIASDLFLEIGTVSEQYVYIFRRGNCRELARLIMHVYENPKEALSRAMTGLSVVKGHTWKRVAERISEIIEELAKVSLL